MGDDQFRNLCDALVIRPPLRDAGESIGHWRKLDDQRFESGCLRKSAWTIPQGTDGAKQERVRSLRSGGVACDMIKR